ncbi:hypothetical protein SKAU_G00184350 [Synaphobranchus kaupii]|uniref:RAD51 interacting motif domain-containing protein n=1 Tax=Synaphobranchus kaupii TaxID=118154 RepID=A0A9Q1FCG1_SYNKA|nr:hypothetical protein SKAU_G00184350 [Synaphobranchus kaupii]
MAYMPSYEAERGINPFETFAKMDKNEFKNEENKARLKTSAEEDGSICKTETKAQVNGRSRDEGVAADGEEYSDGPLVNDVTPGRNSESNGGEKRADSELGFPGGAARERASCAAAAQASFACAEHASGKGLGSASPEPPDVIDVVAVIESHIRCEAGRMRVEQMERITSGCCSPTSEIRSDGAAEGACSDGLVWRSPAGTHIAGFHEGDVNTVQEEAYEEWLSKDYDKIPEESLTLAPSSEVIPVINRIYTLDVLPSAETSAHVDGEFMHSPQGVATVEPTDTRKDFTCETWTEPTEQLCRARKELDRHDHQRLRHEEYHCMNASCTSTAENRGAKSQTPVSKSDTKHDRCKVSDLESPAPSDTDHRMRTADTVSALSESTVANTEERDGSVTAIKLPAASAKVEIEVGERGDVAAAAGWSDAATEKDICEGERGSPRGPSPQTAPTRECVTDDIPSTRQSDATQTLGDEGHPATSVKQPGDAVVPETDAGYGVYLEANSQFPVHCHSDASPAAFDSFEKVPLSLSADGLERSPLLKNSPHNPIRGRPQSYCDVDGPSSEITPMQAPRQPNSDLNKNNEGLAESERHIERSPSQKGSVPDCDSHVVTSCNGGSRGESQNVYLCDITEGKLIPDVYFLPCPPAIDPEQSDQLPVHFSSSAQFCLLPESTQDYFDEQGKLGTCPQPAHSRPQTSVLTPESIQTNSTPRFEMKERFDLVLEELSLFFSIGREAELPVSSEAPHAREGPPEDRTAERDVGRLSDPAVKARGRTNAEQNVHSDTRAFRQRPETTSCNVGFDCEQEVPLGLSHSSAEGEDSMYSTMKLKDRIVAEDGYKHWFPAFMALPVLNEQNRGFLESARRLEPLKTCVRPIRVGLSKRARPKQLHPYFK